MLAQRVGTGARVGELQFDHFGWSRWGIEKSDFCVCMFVHRVRSGLIAVDECGYVEIENRLFDATISSVVALCECVGGREDHRRLVLGVCVAYNTVDADDDGCSCSNCAMSAPGV